MIEIGPSFGATQGKGGEAVLEDLFKTQELQYTQIHSRVKEETPLIGSNGVVKVDPVSQVLMDAPLVVGPGHLENHIAIGFNDPIHDIGRTEMGILIVNFLDGFKDQANRLVVLNLAGVLLVHLIHDGIYDHSSLFCYLML